MKQKLVDTPFYPLLAGLYPVLFLWAANLGQVGVGAVLRALVAAVLLAALVWGACLLLTRKPHPASLMAGSLLLLFFLYGNLLNQVGGKVVLGIELGYAKLLLVFILLMALAVVLVTRTRADLRPVTHSANLVFSLLVVFAVTQILVYETRANLRTGKTDVLAQAAQSTQPGQPDIYYIVLDSYLRSDALLERFDYDNSAFLQGLRERGFYIPECAFSNYPGTSLSIASALNMSYLEDLGVQGTDVFFEDAPPELQQAIHQNRVRRTLAQRGYQFAAFRGFFPINDITGADYYFEVFEDEGWSNELAALNFEHMVANTTLLRAVVEYYQQNPSASLWDRVPMAALAVINPDSDKFSSRSYRWYRQHLYTFDTLETIPDLPGSKFTYAHIYATHQPYVMNADGSFLWPINEDNYNYIPAVEFSSQRTLEVVDAILRKSAVSPVIIVQADHGIGDGIEKHKILNAYYLPGHSDGLYPTITPVNTFRLVLNVYLGEDLPLLNDRLYVVQGPGQVVMTPAECGR